MQSIALARRGVAACMNKREKKERRVPWAASGSSASAARASEKSESADISACTLAVKTSAGKDNGGAGG